MAKKEIKVVRQLRDAEIDAVRKHMSAKQKYRCPLCDGSLAHGINALDHSHSNGSIRAVLCRSCNVSEGKVLAGVLFKTPKGSLGYSNPAEWLRKLADYWDYHNKYPTGIIHPTFDIKTGKQKPVKRKTKKVSKKNLKAF